MSIEQDNKAIVGRWFTNFWGKTCDLSIVDEIAAPEMLLHYSLHEPRSGRDDIKAFMTDFREAFPDLNFWGVADLIAEGDYVVGRWEGGGSQRGSTGESDTAFAITVHHVLARTGPEPGHRTAAYSGEGQVRSRPPLRCVA
jgi:hypothetical protein